MPRPHDQPTNGYIEGLRLPPNAWKALRRMDIRTLPHLRSLLDRLERLPGIGPKTAVAIRMEVARVEASGQREGLPPVEDRPS
jgi:transposase